MLGVIYPNGQKTKYGYFDNIGDQRLKEINNYIAGMISNTPLSDFQYTYNPVGTIATWQQQSDSNTPTVYTLGYDNADQLTSAVQTNTSTSATVSSNAYGYDPAGNRLSETTLSGVTGGQFNNLNQLTALGTTSSQTVSGNTSAPVNSLNVNTVPATVTNGTNFTASVPLPAGTNTLSVVAQPVTGSTTTQQFQTVTTGTAPTPLSYDYNGNTLTDEKGNTYQWDALNRLASITYPGGAISLFAYDGLSRRIQIVEEDASSQHNVTSTKNYLWVGSEIAEERDSSNNVTKRFFPQGEQQSGTPYYYTWDHLGSNREMLNGSGSIVARYAYDPYGRTTLVSGSNLATFQYADLYQHQTSGLYLTEYRAFDTNSSRWLSRDPRAEKEGINLYGYVADDPINMIDPLGLGAGGDDGRGHHPAQHPPDPVNPLLSDFPFIHAPYDNFHWYGNWGGPHVTSGSRHWAEADNFPNDPKDRDFVPPYDNRDTCYYRHDVCLHNAGTIKEPGLRQAARAGCDHSLGDCLCTIKGANAPLQREIDMFHGKDKPSPNDNPGEYVPNAKPYPYNY